MLNFPSDVCFKKLSLQLSDVWMEMFYNTLVLESELKWECELFLERQENLRPTSKLQCKSISFFNKLLQLKIMSDQ